ncbi:hypothetical protein Glove_413g11 [Diversispora epigaea]|uniref:Uncharacterized protein n=1 Tax=Diversispora epigaea TaxID=1348612 RepID=A0A397GXN0_9GLOM|nr:hypothetical protein Glove_413g11 [Diversispora epigaea]
MSYSRVRGKFSEYGENYIVNIIKTPEAWLRFAKYYPPKYIRKRLLKLGYEINSRDYWENFVFRVENNLTSHKQIGNDPKYRDFKVQLALYKKNRSALIIQRAFHLWKKRINSAKIIQHATIQWIYRPGKASRPTHLPYIYFWLNNDKIAMRHKIDRFDSGMYYAEGDTSDSESESDSNDSLELGPSEAQASTSQPKNNNYDPFGSQIAEIDSMLATL